MNDAKILLPILLLCTITCGGAPEAEPEPVLPSPITLKDLTAENRAFRIYAGDEFCVQIRPEGKVGECMAAQCPPEIKGGWTVLDGILNIRYERTYTEPTCMGEKRPFKSDTKDFTYTSFECSFYSPKACRGTAITTDGQSHSIMH